MAPHPPLRIVVGLGNPGPEYVWTRHNIGFHAVDQLAQEQGVLFQSASKLSAFTPVGLGLPSFWPSYSGPRSFEWAHLERHNVLLVKPMSFMNRSGSQVAPLVRYALRVEPEVPPERDEEGEPTLPFDPTRLMIVYDDLDLPLGALRLRPHGGHGGQNGVRSIIEHLGTKAFPRLRIGIGSPGTDAVRHVLETFPAPERVEAEISVREAAEALLDWLTTGDLEKCMSRFHSRWNRES